jgi:integrase
MIEQTASGRYKVTVEVRQGRGQPRRRVSQTVDTADEATDLERRLGAVPAAGLTRTVADAVDLYVATYGPALAPNTERGYQGIRRRYIDGTALAAMPLHQLRPADLEDHYAQLFAGTYRPGASPLKLNTVRSVHRLVSVSLGKAKKRGWTDRNPAADAEVVGPASPPRAYEAYALDTVAKVLDAGGVELSDLVHVAIATGAREGELAGLRWCDVDLMTGAVMFAGSICRKRKVDGPGWMRKLPKSNRPRRVLVDEYALETLRERFTRHVAQIERDGNGVDDLDHRAVFSLDLEDDYTSPAGLGARWSRAAAKAGVSMRFHDLRHVNASELMAANVPAPNAARRNGWSSNRMFLEVYGHHRADADDAAVAALADTWQRIERARKRA